MALGRGPLQGSVRRQSSNKNRLSNTTRRDATAPAAAFATPSAGNNGRQNTASCDRGFSSSCRFPPYWMLLAALGGIVLIQQFVSMSKVQGMSGSPRHRQHVDRVHTLPVKPPPEALEQPDGDVNSMETLRNLQYEEGDVRMSKHLDSAEVTKVRGSSQVILFPLSAHM